MSETSIWRRGHTFGPASNPDEYELRELFHRGGEGELWRARRTWRDGTRTSHAVKILPTEALESPEKLGVWRGRWNDSVHAANGITIAGLIRSTCIDGVQPHVRGEPTEPGGVYLIGPWQEGTRRVDQWARESTDPPAERLRVLVRLSRIIDELHDAGWTHRDISGGNVLVDGAGTPFLIDLTFLTRLDQAISVVVSTPGYATPDEETHGQLPGRSKDCLGVGVLARVLLLPHLPLYERVQDLAAAVPEELAAVGYSDGVAACLLRALDTDPSKRPGRLLPWVEELRRLVAADPDPGQLCMALTTDALDRPVVAVGGDRGPRWFTAVAPDGGPGGSPLLPHDGRPLDVRELATVRDARGDVVVAAVDGGGLLWTGDRDSGWTVRTGHARGLAVLGSARGEVLVWTAQPEGVLCLRLSSDGSPPRQEEFAAAPGSRVLAAAWDAAGRAAVLVAEPDRVVHCTWPAHPGHLPEWATVRAVAAVRGTIALHRGWGELEAALVTADGTRFSLSRHHSGAPWQSVESSREASSRVELRGIRQGIARATAGPEGLTVVTETNVGREASEPTRTHLLHAGPARLVGLHVGRDGNLHVAALVDGNVRCWSETWAEEWAPVALRRA
ncbi:hypothetical protein [Streptomyces sp. NPDC018610]|uniref:hypothetical protein n=1 Tax=Streptomyces sp. NPDC018610 TaxID=3365049 RepID=UPI00378C6712